jgi:hypothetical protein
MTTPTKQRLSMQELSPLCPKEKQNALPYDKSNFDAEKLIKAW